MPTQIGQYRYTGSGCIDSLDSKKEYSDVSVSVGSTDTESVSRTFQDVKISPTSTTFEKNKDYCLRVKIPQDLNYEMNFTIKLIKEDGSSKSYQYLKEISLQRGGNSSNSHQVVLYDKALKDEGKSEIAAMIPLKYPAAGTPIKGLIYYNQSADLYYLGTGSSYERTTRVNSMTMTESWRNEQSKNYGVFDIVFRPVEDGFTYILLEMERLPEDYNIQYTREVNGVTTTFYGRSIDISSMEYSLYVINSLTNYMGSDSLDRIGVWGHSGLMLAVNGEEMRIGPSGFLEVSGVKISSVGVIATGYQDSFTIDYEYTTGGE